MMIRDSTDLVSQGSRRRRRRGKTRFQLARSNTGIFAFYAGTSDDLRDRMMRRRRNPSLNVFERVSTAVAIVIIISRSGISDQWNEIIAGCRSSDSANNRGRRFRSRDDGMFIIIIMTSHR